MSPPQNRYRQQSRQNVRELEKKLSLKERVFSLLAFLRGSRRVVKGIIIVILVLLCLQGAKMLFSYVFSSYSNNTRHITYSSASDIISKEQVLELLGITEETTLSMLHLEELENKLRHQPSIAAAHITQTGNNSLHIEIEEHVPLLFVEPADSAITGRTTRYYLSPEGLIFPIDAKLHEKFNNLPVWRLHAPDVEKFLPGQRISPAICTPIIQLAKEANAYDPAELPNIRSIELPIDNTERWEINMRLENGTSVTMSNLHDIPAQLSRLVKALEHARVHHKKILRINVVPEINIPVVYEQ